MNSKKGQRRKKTSERRQEGRQENGQPHLMRPVITCGGLTVDGGRLMVEG
jgi:hypothetical protein